MHPVDVEYSNSSPYCRLFLVRKGCGASKTPFLSTGCSWRGATFVLNLKKLLQIPLTLSTGAAAKFLGEREMDTLIHGKRKRARIDRSRGQV